jgi:hypothetical protein
MEVLERLAAIDEIRQLKGRYFRFCDLMELEGFLNVFTPDATLVYDLDLPENGAPQQMRFTGRDELEAFCRAMWRIEMLWSAHHGMTAEIDILSVDEARGIWAMQDIVEFRESNFHGFGHYHETYRRMVGGWRIATLHLTRTRLIRTPKPASSGRPPE